MFRARNFMDLSVQGELSCPSYGQRWKDEYIQFIRLQGFTHALTLSWNQGIPLHAARRNLRTLHGMVDGQLFNRRYHKMPRDKRSKAVFIFEKVHTHIHCHSLWKVSSRNLIKFNKLFPGERDGIWNKIAPCGSYKLAFADDWRTFGGYLLKGQHINSDGFEVVWSDEFLPTS